MNYITNINFAGKFNAVIEKIRLAYGRIRACKEVGIEYKDFKKKYTEDFLFQQEVELAEEEAVEKIKPVAIETLIKRIRQDWKAAAWWLERRYPKQFGLRQNIELSGELKASANYVYKSEKELVEEIIKRGLIGTDENEQGIDGSALEGTRQISAPVSEGAE